MADALDQVGVVGLGSMGRSVIEALVGAGHEVTAFDRDPAALAQASMVGATPTVSARQVAAESGLVITVLPGSEQVIEVALDPECGILAGLDPSALLVDMTTAGPDVAAVVGEAFDKAGRRFVDAPVSGRAPRMTVLVGGSPGVLGEHEAVLGDISSELVYCGRRGAGYATKLLNQHIKYAWYLASCEALLVARRLGLDTQATVAALEQCSGATSGLADAVEWFRGDARAVAQHGPARTIDKDMRLARQMADDAGVDVPSLEVVAEFFERVAASPLRERPFPESNLLLEQIRTTKTSS